MTQRHTTGPVRPDTVTLCVDNGTSCWYTPVTTALWDEADEEVRQALRRQARWPSGDSSLPVAVIR